MRLSVAAAIALSAVTLSGQSARAPIADPCPDATTQTDLNICTAQYAGRVTRTLDLTYMALLEKARLVPGATAKVKAAQDAWLAYRDAYVEAMYPLENKQVEYGTMYPMRVNLLRARMAASQLDDLKELLEEYR